MVLRVNTDWIFGWHCVSKRIIIIRKCLCADLLISHFMNFPISVGSIAIKSTWTDFKERNDVASVLCPYSFPEAPLPCVVKLLSVVFSYQGLMFVYHCDFTFSIFRSCIKGISLS